MVSVKDNAILRYCPRKTEIRLHKPFIVKKKVILSIINREGS